MYNPIILSLLVLNTNTHFDGPRVRTCQARYEPFSQEARTLFAEAASSAGVPLSWAHSDGLHYILSNESGGMVGIPNYSIKDEDGKSVRDQPYLWPVIHERIRDGNKGSPKASSSATGLGQLLPVNVDAYYPSGRNGIGDCREEAEGMLRYIKATYGNPNTAWKCYGKLKPKQCPNKRFKEGY